MKKFKSAAWIAWVFLALAGGVFGTMAIEQLAVQFL